jgi:hypothetical protein
MSYDYNVNISVLVGKTLTAATNVDGAEIVFETSEGEVYALYHEQDCCESVYVEDVCGDLEDLVGSPILLAAEVCGECGADAAHQCDTTNPRGPLYEYEESYTWTFYRLSTIKGSVTIRFYGSSNGYYSECVYFTCREKKTFRAELMEEAGREL